ncbi:Mce-associated membrane protein [Rhodococcus sp. OK519]|uniref:mammalian cell entry protein n=1 Tax=Rhodococcus sp. OK519 TaxID=2135729 RepID=UPI000D3D750D|nr:Mce-associated membrane protein [Rhodococcus sp. OK519]
MPPIRRSTKPASSGRRPKIAGAGTSQQGSDVRPPASDVPLLDADGAAAVAVVTVDEGGPAKGDTPVRLEKVDEPAPVTAGGEPGRSGARFGGPNWKLVAGLAVAAIVLAAFAVVAAFKPGVDVSNTAYVDAGGTAEVTEAARTALNTLYSYSPDTIDEYPGKARAVLTENMRGEFDKTIDPTVAAVKQGGTSTTVQVTDVGVKVLDGDRAELIANVTVSAESNGAAQDSASGPLIVRMEKVGDVWLLSDIADQ